MQIDTDDVIEWAESHKVITVGYLVVFVAIIVAKHFLIYRMAHKEGVKEGEGLGRL